MRCGEDDGRLSDANGKGRDDNRGSEEAAPVHQVRKINVKPEDLNSSRLASYEAGLLPELKGKGYTAQAVTFRSQYSPMHANRRSQGRLNDTRGGVTSLPWLRDLCGLSGRVSETQWWQPPPSFLFA